MAKKHPARGSAKPSLNSVKGNLPSKHRGRGPAGFEGKHRPQRNVKPSKGSGSAPKAVVWIVAGVLTAFGSAMVGTVGYVLFGHVGN